LVVFISRRKSRSSLTNQRDSGIRKENQPRLAPIRAYALYEYGRLRAVPKLTDLFQSEDQRLSGEVVSCLSHLLTPEEIDALVRCAGAGGDQTKRKMCAGALESVFNRLGLTQGEYARKSLAGKQTLIDAAIKQTEEKYQLKPGDRRMTHKDLLNAAAEWKANHRITGGTYEWVEDRQVLAVSTPAEIPLLMDVMAACYLRLSDECLYEIQMLRDIVKRIGRSRYRAKVGFCESAEALQGRPGQGR
jgi:hypothetical protein